MTIAIQICSIWAQDIFVPFWLEFSKDTSNPLTSKHTTDILERHRFFKPKCFPELSWPKTKQCINIPIFFLNFFKNSHVTNIKYVFCQFVVYLSSKTILVTFIKCFTFYIISQVSIFNFDLAWLVFQIFQSNSGMTEGWNSQTPHFCD